MVVTISIWKVIKSLKHLMKKASTELRGKKGILEMLAHTEHFSLIKNKSYNHFLIDQSFLMLPSMSKFKICSEQAKTLI